ncbi:hypothetical protein IC582_002653 [Cucumis melo]
MRKRVTRCYKYRSKSEKRGSYFSFSADREFRHYITVDRSHRMLIEGTRRR